MLSTSKREREENRGSRFTLLVNLGSDGGQSCALSSSCSILCHEECVPSLQTAWAMRREAASEGEVTRGC